MNRFTTLTRLSAVLSVLAVTALAGACDNPVEQDHEEHPVGLAIVDAQGQVVASAAGGQAVTGQIAVASGAAQTFTVAVIAEDGDRIPLGGELEARIESQPANATLALQGDRLTVTGAAAGTGTAEIVLMHGGHDELSGAFPVVVE